MLYGVWRLNPGGDPPRDRFPPMDDGGGKGGVLFSLPRTSDATLDYCGTWALRYQWGKGVSYGWGLGRVFV